MATLASQAITRGGLAPAYTAAAVGGDKFTPNKNTILHVKNGSGGALSVTVATPGQAFAGADIGDITVSVPASGERLIGPFPHEHFADPTDGLAHITYSGVTTLTIAALQVASS